MKKKLLIIYLFFLIPFFGYNQSYIGFEAGAMQPFARESNADNDDDFRDKITPDFMGDFGSSRYGTRTYEIEEQTGFYVSGFIKERVSEFYNFGFSCSFSYIDLKYRESTASRFGPNGSKNHLTSYRFHAQIELEFNIYKKVVFFNFGPILEVPLSTYTTTHSNSYSPAGYHSFSSGKKGGTFLSIGSFVGFSFEKKISDTKIVFLNSEISYQKNRSYNGLKMYNMKLGVGIKFFFPNLIIGHKNNNTSVGQPYILN